jgi:hypothetical protein
MGFVLLVAVFFVVGCHGDKSNKDKLNDSTTKKDISFLDDENFVFKNLANTEDAKGIYKELKGGGVDGNLYTDSTYKKLYVKLTPEQRSILVAPFISKQLDVNDKYARDLMQAYFISKQDKIGEFQPIIIEVDGDDYGSMILVVLDKNNKPIDAFNLSGGIERGPMMTGDSLLSFDKPSYSFLTKNLITTYRVTETDYTDSTKKEETIDSNVFVSTIDKTGKIITKQTVKAHFRKP